MYTVSVSDDLFIAQNMTPLQQRVSTMIVMSCNLLDRSVQLVQHGAHNAKVSGSKGWDALSLSRAFLQACLMVWSSHASWHNYVDVLQMNASDWMCAVNISTICADIMRLQDGGRIAV